MSDAFVQQYAGVLHRIEFTIVLFKREHPELLDYDVDAALETAVTHYAAEARLRVPRRHTLPEMRRELYDALIASCEGLLGRGDALLPGEPTVSADEIAACLKRVRTSVQRRTREGGREGYLSFIRRYVH